MRSPTTPCSPSRSTDGRVRNRRTVSATDAVIDALLDEVRLFAERLRGAGLDLVDPLTPAELSTAVRLRSDPGRSPSTNSVASSLAAATGRDSIEWGPMATERSWGHVAVDSSMHRCFRVATWPMLPVGADWLAPLIGTATATRTVTVVME